ncbi:hypothetical protein ABVN80_19820 [Acinetobacter baumannii]
MRSKGFFWLAAEPTLAYSRSQAGAMRSTRFSWLLVGSRCKKKTGRVTSQY